MPHIIVPKDYEPKLTIRETEVAIKKVKDHFQKKLAENLNLTRVSAPLFVEPESGLNDNLNGVERPVSFGIREQGDSVCEVVHSLAKWKRLALKRYGFCAGEGLYTDMNAIRRDEDTDNLHSLYVDQWDWEKIIDKRARNEETLRQTVDLVYDALKDTDRFVCREYPCYQEFLPEHITFITSQELEDQYPQLSPKERENAAAKEFGAIFVMGIGGALRSGEVHDGRAPDYDDWSLNGDILVYYPVLGIAVELSSMGIRVDEEALTRQLKIRGCEERARMPFQQALLSGELPQTIGGGIGQSRICMVFLRKAHIGEVQSSIWTKEDQALCENAHIRLL